MPSSVASPGLGLGHLIGRTPPSPQGKALGHLRQEIEAARQSAASLTEGVRQAAAASRQAINQQRIEVAKAKLRVLQIGALLAKGAGDVDRAHGIAREAAKAVRFLRDAGGEGIGGRGDADPFRPSAPSEKPSKEGPPEDTWLVNAGDGQLALELSDGSDRTRLPVHIVIGGRPFPPISMDDVSDSGTAPPEPASDGSGGKSAASGTIELPYGVEVSERHRATPHPHADGHPSQGQGNRIGWTEQPAVPEAPNLHDPDASVMDSPPNPQSVVISGEAPQVEVVFDDAHPAVMPQASRVALALDGDLISNGGGRVAVRLRSVQRHDVSGDDGAPAVISLGTGDGLTLLELPGLRVGHIKRLGRLLEDAALTAEAEGLFNQARAIIRTAAKAVPAERDRGYFRDLVEKLGIAELALSGRLDAEV